MLTFQVEHRASVLVCYGKEKPVQEELVGVLRGELALVQRGKHWRGAGLPEPSYHGRET